MAAETQNEQEEPVVVDGAADEQSASQAAYGATSYGGMVTPPGQQSPEKHVSYFGTASRDADFTKYVNRVITLCLITVGVKCAVAIVGFCMPGAGRADKVQKLIQALIGLAIPFCGYIGAKNESKGWMCCFCGWEWVGVVVCAIMLGSTIFAATHREQVAAAGFAISNTDVVVSICSCVVTLLLHLVCAWYGLKLYKKLNKGHIAINNPVFVTNATQAQPLVAGMNV